MRALLVLLPALGCGGHYASSKPGRGSGDDALPRGVMAAALPYAIVDGRTGSAVTEAAFWDALGAARVVCVGEDHPNPHHHWAQLQVVDHLSAHYSTGPKTWALGMEMVQRPFQAVLDDFAGGRIDAAALQSRTGWEDRWGYDFALYEPMLSLATKRGGALVALNAARELTKKVVRQGLEALTADERAGLATEVVLDDAEHRAWFDAIMEGMGGAHGHTATPGPETEEAPAPPPEEPAPEMPSAERVYTVQVLWDETMAESAATWVGAAGKSMVVLAGNGHCHDSAIVRRVVRRGVSPVVSVRPIIDDDEGSVAEAILEASNDYLFVMTMPADVSGS